VSNLAKLTALALVPFTVTGSLLGLLYLSATGRHPSPNLLMVFGFVGVLSFVGIAVWLATHG
jgi:hypothetical protein